MTSSPPLIAMSTWWTLSDYIFIAHSYIYSSKWFSLFQRILLNNAWPCFLGLPLMVYTPRSKCSYMCFFTMTKREKIVYLCFEIVKNCISLNVSTQYYNIYLVLSYYHQSKLLAIKIQPFFLSHACLSLPCTFPPGCGTVLMPPSAV